MFLLRVRFFWKLDMQAVIEEADSKNAGVRKHLDRLQLPNVRRAFQKLKPKRSVVPVMAFRPTSLGIVDCYPMLVEPLFHIYLECEVVTETGGS